ncbi:hypothetical protein VTO73DRAFT_290 [Trametes versicolor]
MQRDGWYIRWGYLACSPSTQIIPTQLLGLPTPPLLTHTPLFHNNPLSPPPHHSNGSSLPRHLPCSVTGPLRHARSRPRLLRLLAVEEAQHDHRPLAHCHPQGLHRQGQVSAARGAPVHPHRALAPPLGCRCRKCSPRPATSPI